VYIKSYNKRLISDVNETVLSIQWIIFPGARFMEESIYLKGVWIILAVLIVILSPGLGKTASFVWNTGGGVVEGFKVYYGMTPNDLSGYRDAGNTTRYDLNRLPLSEGVTYYLRVSAYNAAGESPPCAPVVFTPGDNTPPAPPGGLVAE
jgi:hypothetical protein